MAPLSEGDDKILESAANVIFEANPDVVITSFGKGDIETDAYPVSTSGEMTTMKQLLQLLENAKAIKRQLDGMKQATSKVAEEPEVKVRKAPISLRVYYSEGTLFLPCPPPIGGICSRDAPCSCAPHRNIPGT